MDEFEPLTAASPVAPQTKKCYRHQWMRCHLVDDDDRSLWHVEQAHDYDTAGHCHPGFICTRCWKQRDEARSRRGRLNKNRGRAIEREVCEMLGWMPIGGANGPADGIGMTSLTIGQVKSGGRFPTWMQRELDKLPRTGGRVPVLAIAETPGPGKKRRVLVVLEARDWVDLHG